MFVREAAVQCVGAMVRGARRGHELDTIGVALAMRLASPDKPPQYVEAILQCCRHCVQRPDARDATDGVHARLLLSALRAVERTSSILVARAGIAFFTVLCTVDATTASAQLRALLDTALAWKLHNG